MAHYTIETSGPRCYVATTGDLTASMVPELKAALQGALTRGAQELVVDLGQAAALDSSGIGLLIAAHNSLSQKQGKLRVINVSEDILQLMQSLRLVHRFSITGRPNP